MNKRKVFLLYSLSLLALAGCNKESNVVPNPLESGELAVLPMNGVSASRMTKGYVEESKFVETTYESLHGTKTFAPRTMQLSAYLTPQNGEAKNYFVDKTYSQSGEGSTTWWNTDTPKGAHNPIYWPVGGTLDFLAYSVSSEESGAGKSQNIKAVWDNTNAAQKVTLTVPGENTQNDILFASAYGEKSRKIESPVNMTFNHSQAWLEFVLSGSVDSENPDGIVTLRRIELEDVYNAGVLNIANNGGNAIAKWDFSDEVKQNIEVDNFSNVAKLNGTPQHLDMLIPQQTKTAFVIYYTLGSSSKELSYRFTTDQKTWLMGEKYIYKINITTSEVTVEPKVTPWSGPVQGFEYTVTYNAGDEKGKVTVSDIFGGKDNGEGTITIDTWGAQVTLEAEPASDDIIFVKWSDGVTENPRTFTITESGNLPEAIFAEKVSVSVSANLTDFGSFEIDGESLTSKKVIPGTDVTLKAEPASSDFVFIKWEDGETDPERTVTVTDNIEYKAVFSYKITGYLPVGYVFGTSSIEYLDANKAELKALAPEQTSFVKWIKEDGTEVTTKATFTTVPSEITAATNFIPVFKSNAASKYVDIITELNDDKSVKTHTKWAKQNLSITASGEKQWKGDNASAVIVPGTSENVKNGDYFQFGAYAGYCGDAEDTDKGLLLYESFTSKLCVDDAENKFAFKIGKSFKSESAPYYSGSAYTKYTGELGDSKTLESADDVASIILGSSWRMPESAEFQALKDATVWAWDETDKGYYVFTPDASNKAGKRVSETTELTKPDALLFFPAAGYGNGNSLNFGDVGNSGVYWSSSRLTSSSYPNYARSLQFDSSSVQPQCSGNRRAVGGSVRPVSD